MIKIANAPCSWGVLEFDLEGEPLGFEQVLDEIKDTGYEGTEFGDWGFLPTTPNNLRQELLNRDLELLGAFIPAAFADPNEHQKAQNQALKISKLMYEAGYREAFIILADDNGKDSVRTQNAGRISPEQGFSEQLWLNFNEGVQKVALAVKEAFGLRTVFHHHCGGFVETPAEVNKLLDLTDPKLLGLCFDTGHYRFGGGDPANDLNGFSDRIWHVHFKDCHPEIAQRSREKNWDYFESVRQGVFCELGKGEVDFFDIIQQLLEKNYNGWIVVEQDVLPGMGSPKVCARNNRNYLKNLGL